MNMEDTTCLQSPAFSYPKTWGLKNSYQNKQKKISFHKAVSTTFIVLIQEDVNLFMFFWT